MRSFFQLDFSYFQRRYSYWIFFVVTLSVLGWGFGYTSPGRYVEERFGSAVLFQARQMLGLAPAVNSRLKIYAHDDKMVSYLQRPYMTPQEWSTLIRSLAPNLLHAVVVDRVFGVFEGGADKMQLEELGGSFAQVPMFVGAWASKEVNPNGHRLDMGRPEYSLLEMTQQDLSQVSEFPMSDKLVAYGPATDLAPYVHGIGHFLYTGQGRVNPLLRVADDLAVPHITSLTSESIEVKDNEFYLNGKHVPLDRWKKLPVNFPDVRELESRVFSLRSLFVRAKRGVPHGGLDEKDYVLIIPAYFTGHLDTGWTPLGRQPLGFVLASLLNSALNEKWLSVWSLSLWLTLLATLLGGGVGLLQNKVALWGMSFALAVTSVGMAIFIFCWFGVIFPWLSWVPLFLLAVLFVASHRGLEQQRTALGLEAALGGLVPNQALRELIREPERFKKPASEKLMTIAFLDIVGFSAMAERESPEKIFGRLKSLLGDFTEIVHHYGGVVDKTLGDGMLFFFGYDFSEQSPSETHGAEEAIACAMEIQRRNLQKNLQLLEEDESEVIVPLRIGINTAYVYIGDLGTESRIDYTVIGQGVNLAQRLESACAPFAVMMSDATRTYAKLTPEGLEQKRVRAKHRGELFAAWELDPFIEEREQVDRACRLYAEYQTRREVRWTVYDPGAFTIQVQSHDVVLRDFSRFGMSVSCEKHLKGSVSVVIHQGGQSVKRYQAEVRWHRLDEEVFHHGLQMAFQGGREEKEFYEVFLREVHGGQRQAQPKRPLRER
ncbi:MAG: adenylate/guanylate cyclase domain-containing protein [Oligoflexales bacterium]